MFLKFWRGQSTWRHLPRLKVEMSFENAAFKAEAMFLVLIQSA